MESVSRRELFVRAGIGLAVAGGTMLRADAQPTPRGNEPLDYERLLAVRPSHSGSALSERRLMLHGRVWGADTRRPVAGATLDFWPTSKRGDRLGTVPGRRAAVVTDSSGRYELQLPRPACFRQGRDILPARLHLLARHDDYPTLVTQLFLAGDPYLDPAAVHGCPILEVMRRTVGGETFDFATFDLVLAAH